MINTGSTDFIFSPGEVIKSFRGKRSLREVARRLELNHSYLNKIEAGTRKPSPDNLLAIGQEYGIPFNIIKRLAEFYKLDISSFNYINTNRAFEVKQFKSQNTTGKGVNITWTIIKISR